MAAVEVVMPPPPPVPVVRVSRHVLAAADTVVCLWIASLWVLLASVAAALIELLACSWWCTGATLAAVLVSLLFVAIVWILNALLLNKFEEAFDYINQLEKGAAALESISEDVITARHVATMAFSFLEAFGILLKLLAFATQDPLTEIIASVIVVVSPLGISVMCCLFSIPGLEVRVWRMKRHGRASVVPI